MWRFTIVPRVYWSVASSQDNLIECPRLAYPSQ